MSESGERSPGPNRIAVRPAQIPAPAQPSAEDGGDGDLRQTLGLLSERLGKIAAGMERTRLEEYAELSRHPWELIWRNLLYGTSRGIGIALGFTFFAASIVWVLQILGKLNLPIVGDYIADIVRIVQRQLQIKPY